jgi:hypothetical protein
MRIAIVLFLVVVGVLLVLAVATAVGVRRFREDNARHARVLLNHASKAPTSILRDSDITHLPAPVQRWLRASGAVGQPRAKTARLRQRGAMRTAPNRSAMQVEALQYFTIDEPGFVWTVELVMFGMPVVGRDSYVNGRGRMYITIGGLVPVADGTGPRFDQGTALRFLGEIIWFPSAALASYIRWEAIDDAHAKAHFAFHDVKTSALFTFDPRGRFTELAADRYYDGESLERWVIPASEWKVIRGIEMPTRGGAVWKLAAGDFDYYQWEVTDVEVNQAALWDAR